jgi:hypothetical protein
MPGIVLSRCAAAAAAAAAVGSDFYQVLCKFFFSVRTPGAQLCFHGFVVRAELNCNLSEFRAAGGCVQATVL